MSVSTRIRLLSAVVLAILFSISTSANGQAVYGSIFGTVTDATGAVVPDAEVGNCRLRFGRRWRDSAG